MGSVSPRIAPLFTWKRYNGFLTHMTSAAAHISTLDVFVQHFFVTARDFCLSSIILIGRSEHSCTGIPCSGWSSFSACLTTSLRWGCGFRMVTASSGCWCRDTQLLSWSELPRAYLCAEVIGHLPASASLLEVLDHAHLCRWPFGVVDSSTKLDHFVNRGLSAPGIPGTVSQAKWAPRGRSVK